jgi:hypothetical protein
MLNKTLLRNENWHVTIGMLGFGEITIKSAAGYSESASAAERGHVLDSLIALGRRRLPFEEFMKVRELILSDFAEAICEQRSGDPLAIVYTIFFGNAPGSSIDHYLKYIRKE